MTSETTSQANLWDRWLLVVGWLVVLFGLLLAVFNRSAPMEALVHRNVDPAFWVDGPSTQAIDFRSWVYGVLGATMAGWGVLIVALAKNAFARRERWARDALATGAGLWFVVDTWLSLASGVVFNAAFNILILVALAPPLGATWRSFRSAR
ncbi:MAG: hypothetical protein HY698_19580 [Deltaproteobacteria bacterium]|nr:hypothetical protein [Deltaproteobacteria bacterium]